MGKYLIFQASVSLKQMFTQNNAYLAGSRRSRESGDRRAHDASVLTGEGGGVKQQ